MRKLRFRDVKKFLDKLQSKKKKKEKEISWESNKYFSNTDFLTPT